MLPTHSALKLRKKHSIIPFCCGFYRVMSSGVSQENWQAR